jgi:hypothetical protein
VVVVVVVLWPALICQFRNVDAANQRALINVRVVVEKSQNF